MYLLYATDHHEDAYLEAALRECGHVVDTVGDPADGVAMAAQGDYEALVLDWTSPSAGWTGCFAAAGRGALLLVIGAAGDEGRRTAVLKAGADACFTRPVPFIEFEARLEALSRLVRRARSGADATGIRLTTPERTANLEGASVPLSLREFRLLEHLVAHAGEVIDMERLQQHAWGEASEPQPELVRACIARIRRKLAALSPAPLIHTVAGHGYVLRPVGGT